MSYISNPFFSGRVPFILKEYFNLTNSDILKEKESYYLSYKLVNRAASDVTDEIFFEEPEPSYKIIDPKLSMYRYFCSILKEPCFALQTALDSYIKSLELMGSSESPDGLSTHSHYNQRREGISPNTNYARQFVEYLQSTQDYGINITTSAESYESSPGDTEFDMLQRPATGFHVVKMGEPNHRPFGWLAFTISGTSTEYNYSWQTRQHVLQGSCAYSPFMNLDGEYIILSFPTSNDELKPFYADYVCFKVKQQHIRHMPVEGEEVPAHGRTPTRPILGSDMVDVYAEIPNDYDKVKNNQTVLGLRNADKPGRSGGWSPVEHYGGYHSSWCRRRTFMRWSSNNIQGPWKFNGRYYGDHYHKEIKQSEIPNLGDFAFSKDKEDCGKGKIFIDDDKILYCPLTGYPLRVCSRTSTSYRDLEFGRTDWY